MTYNHAQHLTTPNGTVRCPACTTVGATLRCDCGAYVIALGRKDKVLTQNVERKINHYTRAAIVKTWRDAAHVLCKAAKIPAIPAIIVYVEYCPTNSIRRDAGNIYPTAKAIVDGIVDAGIIPDDDWHHCDGPRMSIGPIMRPANVTLAIIPAVMA